MSEISGRTLALAIQAVGAEMRRLRALPEADTVPGDELLLLDYENAADALRDLYEEAMAAQPSLPSYEQLVGRQV